MAETKTRSLLKSLSWRITATITTIALVYLFSGKAELAIMVGSVEIVAKLAVYYAHERLWTKVKYGRE